MRRALVLIVCVAAGLAGCKEDPRTVVEDAVFDKLECEEVARPSTLGRLRAMLDDPNLDNAAALALNPQDLATLVSVAGPEVEGSVIVVRNLLDISPTTKALVAHGFDGLDFQCDDGEELDCTAGSEIVSVSCDKDGKANAVDVIADKCTVGGYVVDGALTLVKEGDGARAIFDAVSINETKVITGDARLAVGAESFAASVTSGDGGLRITDFGGPKSGLECGEELRVNELAVSEKRVALSGSQVTTEETYGIDTDVSFDDGCACPLPGSRVSLETPDSGKITVDYGDGDGGSCAKATVSLAAYPAKCVGIECGKKQTEAALSSLLTSLCATTDR